MVTGDTITPYHTGDRMTLPYHTGDRMTLPDHTGDNITPYHTGDKTTPYHTGDNIPSTKMVALEISQVDTVFHRRMHRSAFALSPYVKGGVLSYHPV